MYLANENRYKSMRYTRCGHSGLKLPALSLGLWHNFGSKDNFDNMQAMCRAAFDAGITHFDLANNYGPVGGSAEENFGILLNKDLAPYRNELIISTKAGYYMWEGPYGDWGSRKYLIASADASLKRMGLDYVDIFYHHRPDPETPLEETMQALDTIVKSGRALYAGLSNYNSAQSEKAAAILKDLKCPYVINQSRYSMLDRHIEADGLMASAAKAGYGIIAFCPLAQGLLTSKYLGGVPEDSRIRRDGRFLHETDLTKAKLDKIKALNALALKRGQTLAQMALAWTLREGGVTSALIGASRAAQITENVQALDAPSFTQAELDAIDKILL